MTDLPIVPANGQPIELGHYRTRNDERWLLDPKQSPAYVQRERPSRLAGNDRFTESNSAAVDRPRPRAPLNCMDTSSQ